MFALYLGRRLALFLLVEVVASHFLDEKSQLEGAKI